MNRFKREAIAMALILPVIVAIGIIAGWFVQHWPKGSPKNDTPALVEPV